MFVRPFPGLVLTCVDILTAEYQKLTMCAKWARASPGFHRRQDDGWLALTKSFEKNMGNNSADDFSQNRASWAQFW
jgi:hypothetical protein